ncbi:MAG: ABC transporter ATP-binding protein [Pseudomonadota bacterium]
MLELQSVGKRVGDAMHLSDISLKLEPGSLNVLLGPTLSGKTSLMRIMAGLDRPTSGRVLVDGEDVTGRPVQKRDVAMVYQQFINYPTLTVFENIASPLRLAKADAGRIAREVERAADLLKLTPYLDRTPLNLSGGQQQRTAIARAIVKNAGLVLLDEPLANLDYKLREELREELPKIFAESGAIFVYATTEPSEALLLGGRTATLREGRVTQFGPTVEVYRAPIDLETARTFSDPPLNTTAVTKTGAVFRHGAGEDAAEIPVATAYSGLPDGAYTLGLRPYHLSLQPTGEDSVPLQAEVVVTEIAGSESFVHVRAMGEEWIVLTHGIHDLAQGEAITIHARPGRALVFDKEGRTLTPDAVTSLAAPAPAASSVEAA